MDTLLKFKFNLHSDNDDNEEKNNDNTGGLKIGFGFCSVEAEQKMNPTHSKNIKAINPKP